MRGGSLLPTSALQSSCWCLCRHWNEGKIYVGLCPCLMRSCPASSYHQHIQWLTGCQLSHFLSSLALDVRRISMKSWICLQFLFWVPGVWHTHSPFFGVNCSHVVYMENSQDSFCSVFRQDFFLVHPAFPLTVPLLSRAKSLLLPPFVLCLVMVTGCLCVGASDSKLSSTQPRGALQCPKRVQPDERLSQVPPIWPVPVMHTLLLLDPQPRISALHAVL